MIICLKFHFINACGQSLSIMLLWHLSTELIPLLLSFFLVNKYNDDEEDDYNTKVIELTMLFQVTFYCITVSIKNIT